MKVNKRALIHCGTGTVLEVLEALRETEVPSDAKILSIKDDYSDALAKVIETGVLPTGNGDGSLGTAVMEVSWMRDEKGLDL